MRTADCGREDLPLFVAGRLDYPDATDHIARGLAYNPSWWKLRHYERPDSERSWKDGYPETDDPDATPPCIGSGTLPDPTATACDEYPFLKTEQGATANSNGVPHLPFSPLPHLKIIDASQNSGSGSRLSGFVLRCKMQLRRDSPDARYGYGHFLVVPVQDVPTYGFCNGQNPPG